MQRDTQERLRSFAEHPASSWTVPLYVETLQEAADEIEALRKALHEISEVGRHSQSKLVQAIHTIAIRALYGKLHATPRQNG